MPHKSNCQDKSELFPDETGDDICMNCLQAIKPNEDQILIQEQFLAEKKKRKLNTQVD